MKIKKSLAAILTLCMIVPLASCNNQDSSSEKNDAPSAAVSSDNRSKYYCSPFVFKIVDDNTFEPVKIYDEKVMSDTKIPDTMKEYYEKTVSVEEVECTSKYDDCCTFIIETIDINNS